MGKTLSRGTVNKRQTGNCAAHVIEFFRICKLVKLVSTSWSFLGIIPTYKDSSMTFPYHMSSPCPPLRFEVFINILGPFSYKIRLLGTTLTSRCDQSWDLCRSMSDPAGPTDVFLPLELFGFCPKSSKHDPCPEILMILICLRLSKASAPPVIPPWRQIGDWHDTYQNTLDSKVQDGGESTRENGFSRIDWKMPESNAQSFKHNSHISHIKGDVWASPIFRRTRNVVPKCVTGSRPGCASARWTSTAPKWTLGRPVMTQGPRAPGDGCDIEPLPDGVQASNLAKRSKFSGKDSKWIML